MPVGIHHHKNHPAGASHGNPSVLIVFSVVEHDVPAGIAEYTARNFKSDAMLAQVLLSLVGVPVTSRALHADTTSPPDRTKRTG